MKFSSTVHLITNRKTERLAFYVIVLLALCSVWLQPAFISMDGPAHLYNAHLLNLYAHSDVLPTYLQRTAWYLPNYCSHWVLQALLRVFDALTAEKLLVSGLIFLLALSFRLVLKVLNANNIVVAFMVLPLLMTNLLYNGFYNFTLSLALLLLQFYFTLRYIQNPAATGILKLLLTAALLYYSNLLSLTLAAILSSLYAALYLKNKQQSSVRLLLPVVLVYVPFAALAVLFVTNVHVPFYDYDYVPSQKSMALLNFKPGIGFDEREELPYSILFPCILLLMTGAIFSRRVSSSSKLMLNDLFLFFVVVFVYLLFHSKNGDLGGMFIDRQLSYLFLLWSLWVACNARVSAWLLPIAAILCFQTYKLVEQRLELSKKVQGDVMAVITAGNYMMDKSTVRVHNFSEHWFQAHISNYTALTKEVVLTENYEASLGWFPLSWSQKVLEARALGVEVEDDYVLVLGKDHPAERKALEQNLQSKHWQWVHTSGNLFCTLYRSPNATTVKP